METVYFFTYIYNEIRCFINNLAADFLIKIVKKDFI